MTDVLRLATFNLENWDESPDFEARAAVLRPQLLRLDADVLCLQEVHGQPSRKHRMRALDALDRLFAGTIYAGRPRAFTAGKHGPFDVHNLVVVSRFPILTSTQIRHDLVAPLTPPIPVARNDKAVPATLEWDRPALHVALDLGAGRILHVLNLHLRAARAAPVAGGRGKSGAWADTSSWAEGFTIATLKRAGQALEARLFVDRLFDDDARALVAVCGDLNAGLGEAPVRTLLARVDDTGNVALAGRALAPLEADVDPARRFTVLHAGRRVLLDHILASRALLGHFEGAEIHNETLADEVLAEETRAGETPRSGPLGSFHAPLLARFRFVGD
ncbi:MAG: endonuclease/exonuclease/phosphatase family protein [Alphaproteobacteria bacterium]